jgi:hypothetical protein
MKKPPAREESRRRFYFGAGERPAPQNSPGRKERASEGGPYKNPRRVWVPFGVTGG